MPTLLESSEDDPATFASRPRRILCIMLLEETRRGCDLIATSIWGVNPVISGPQTFAPLISFSLVHVHQIPVIFRLLTVRPMSRTPCFCLYERPWGNMAHRAEQFHSWGAARTMKETFSKLRDFSCRWFEIEKLWQFWEFFFIRKFQMTKRI